MSSLPKITLTTSDIRGAFDPVVDKIYIMVNEQILNVNCKKGKDPKVPKYLSTPALGSLFGGLLRTGDLWN